MCVCVSAAKKSPPPPPRSDDEAFTAAGLHKAQAARGREPTMKAPPPCVVPRKSLSAALSRSSSSAASAPATNPMVRPTSSDRRWIENLPQAGTSRRPKRTAPTRGSFSESVRGPGSRNSSPASSVTGVARAICETHTQDVWLKTEQTTNWLAVSHPNADSQKGKAGKENMPAEMRHHLLPASHRHGLGKDQATWTPTTVA